MLFGRGGLLRARGPSREAHMAITIVRDETALMRLEVRVGTSLVE
jgi:hypothetical protein